MPKKKSEAEEPVEEAVAAEDTPAVEDIDGEPAVDQPIEEAVAAADTLAVEDINGEPAVDQPVEEAVATEDVPIVEEIDSEPVEEAVAAEHTATPSEAGRQDVDSLFGVAESNESAMIVDLRRQRDQLGSYEEITTQVDQMDDGPEKERAKRIIEAVFTDDAPVVKTAGRVVKVRQFFGAYRDVVFHEDERNEFGVAKDVSDETLSILRNEFPGAEIVIE